MRVKAQSKKPLLLPAPQRFTAIAAPFIAPLLLGLCFASLSHTTEQYALGSIEQSQALLISSDSQLAYFSGGGTGGNSNMGNTTGNTGGMTSSKDSDKEGSGAGSTRGGDNDPGARSPGGSNDPKGNGGSVQGNGNNTSDPDKEGSGDGSTRGGDKNPTATAASDARAAAAAKAQTQAQTAQKQTDVGTFARSLSERFGFTNPATTPSALTTPKVDTPAQTLTDKLTQPYNMGNTAVDAVAEKAKREAALAAQMRSEALADQLTNGLPSQSEEDVRAAVQRYNTVKEVQRQSLAETNPDDFKQPAVNEPFNTPMGYLGDIVDPNALKTPVQREAFVKSMLSNVYGMPDNQVNAIVGNLKVESANTFDPNIVGDKNLVDKAFGIAQERAERAASLAEFSGVKDVGQTNLDDQVAHVVAEMQGTSPNPDAGAIKVGNEFAKNPNMSVAEATKTFAKNFERPLGSNVGTPKTAKQAADKAFFDRTVAERTAAATKAASVKSFGELSGAPKGGITSSDTTSNDTTNNTDNTPTQNQPDGTIPTPRTKPTQTPTNVPVVKSPWSFDNLVKITTETVTTVVETVTPTPEQQEKIKTFSKLPGWMQNIAIKIMQGGPAKPTNGYEGGGGNGGNIFPTSGGNNDNGTTTKSGSNVAPIADQSWWQKFKSKFVWGNN